MNLEIKPGRSHYFLQCQQTFCIFMATSLVKLIMDLFQAQVRGKISLSQFSIEQSRHFIAHAYISHKLVIPLFLTHHQIETIFFLVVPAQFHQQIEDNLPLVLLVNKVASVCLCWRRKDRFKSNRLLLPHRVAELSHNARASLHHFFSWQNALWCSAKATSSLLKIPFYCHPKKFLIHFFSC